MEIRERILKLKKFHAIFSSIFFFSALFFCIWSASDLNISEISLSSYGINNKTSIIWNSSLFVVGIFLYFSSMKNIMSYYKSSRISTTLICSFTISIICLLATSLINMNYWIHNYTAIFYFIGYTVSIFLFGFNLLKTDFRIGISSILISILLFVLPIVSLFYFKGLAIPEIVHTLFVFLWIMIIGYDSEYKYILKKVGF